VNDSATTPPLRLAAILHTAHAAQAQVEAKLDRIGLSMAKLAALGTLSDAGESLPLGQLADRLACVKSNITQLVDRLEADGLVVRELDPRDRRTKLAVLTSAGRKACIAGNKILQESERQLLKRFSRDELQHLASLLEKMHSEP
jgi:DNA-binding MarR family transcriptional regulator